MNSTQLKENAAKSIEEKNSNSKHILINESTPKKQESKEDSLVQVQEKQKNPVLSDNKSITNKNNATQIELIESPSKNEIEITKSKKSKVDEVVDIINANPVTLSKEPEKSKEFEKKKDIPDKEQMVVSTQKINEVKTSELQKQKEKLKASPNLREQISTQEIQIGKTRNYDQAMNEFEKIPMPNKRISTIDQAQIGDSLKEKIPKGLEKQIVFDPNHTNQIEDSKEMKPNVIKPVLKESLSQMAALPVIPKKKRERRNKDENSQRNYICGCKKKYLSYAALYTHAKTKHNGIFPEGTTTLHKKRQGRPKKDEWCALKISAEYQKTSDFNKDFLHYLDMIPGAKAEKEDEQTNLVAHFPVEWFQRDSDYQGVYLKVEQIRKDLVENYGTNFLSQIDVIIYEINNAKSLNCNEIFALFLIYVFRFVRREFYRELVFFIVSYKVMMNQKGWEKCKDMSAPFDFSKEFCEEQNAEFVPDFANYYILDYFPECFDSGKILKEVYSQLKFFGTESIKLLRIILLIKHFCSWLYNNKFTKAKIDIFKE